MELQNPRLTISLPCYGRPLRTRRAIECIMNQDMNGWEAIIQGDNCPHFQELIDSGHLENLKLESAKKGNSLIYKNYPQNYGGCGYHLTNQAIKAATGKYFIFFANDDVIESNHFSHYLKEIENTNYDFIYFNSYVAPDQAVRQSFLRPCHIGHSELIIRTEFLKQQPPHSATYGHDWDLIQHMANTGSHAHADSQDYTYKVMKMPYGCVDNFD